MKLEPLPELLKPGDRIACQRRAGENRQYPPEVLTVLKLCPDGRVLLCREEANGVRAFADQFEMRTLRDYDYRLVKEAE